MTTTATTPAPSKGGVAPLKLHDYQLHAVQFLQMRKRAGLFLDMGLG